MPVADAIRDALGSQSMIRKMFEEGARLKNNTGPARFLIFRLATPISIRRRIFTGLFRGLLRKKRKAFTGICPTRATPKSARQ